MADRFLTILARPGRNIERMVDDISDFTELSCYAALPGMALFTSAAGAAIALPDGGGWIVGTAFHRSRPYPRLISISERDGAIIQQSDGTALMGLIWGGYLGFIRADDGQSIIVIREPSAALPCVHIETPDAVIFASDIGLLTATGLYKPEVDWPALARHLALSDLKSTRTCLVGVSELLAGHRLTLTAFGTAIDPIWSPWEFVKEEASASLADLAAELRFIVSNCVAAWAQPYGHILLGASGGLDSSILAAILALGNSALTCLNMTTDEGEGDERRYARALANHLSLNLREAHHRLEDVDITRPISAHLPRPASYVFGQSEQKTKRWLIDSLGIDALFTGIGGDNVFCSMPSATPLVDYVRTFGLVPSAWRVLRDICDLTGASVWQVAAAAQKRAGQPTAYPWSLNRDFLTEHALAIGAYDLSHPWLVPPDGAAPGKAAHIAMLLRITGTIDGFPRDSFPPQINPLISQPIMEACLAIPTWQWVAGGQNRSVARRAFAGMLPPVLVNRQSKGGPNSFAYDVMETHKPAVRDLLEGGLLAQHDLIDTSALARALRDDAPFGQVEYIRLAILTEAEVWARHWSGAVAGKRPPEPKIFQELSPVRHSRTGPL